MREESHLDDMRSAIRGDFERLERRRGMQELMHVSQRDDRASVPAEAALEPVSEPVAEPVLESLSEPASEPAVPPAEEPAAPLVEEAPVEAVFEEPRSLHRRSWLARLLSR